jgi:DNA-binding NarL/FixJ family response regulator
MKMMHFLNASVLIVDDFEPWRSQIRDILKAHPEWKIISEACDGAEAVQKAAELQPDIIVLDIGLPKLNGIEAAKIIRQSSPNSRIIFLTQNTDTEIVNAALRVGRASYVQKADAATELLEAIRAALRDR